MFVIIPMKTNPWVKYIIMEKRLFCLIERLEFQLKVLNILKKEICFLKEKIFSLQLYL